MKIAAMLILFMAFPVYAGNSHHDHSPPEPTPINVPNSGDNGSNFWSNMGEAAVWSGIICGICIAADGCRIPFTKKVICKVDKQPFMKSESSLVPEVPKNEYTYQIKP